MKFRIIDVLYNTDDYDEAHAFWKGAAATIVSHKSQDRLSVKLERDSEDGRWSVYLQEYR